VSIAQLAAASSGFGGFPGRDAWEAARIVVGELDVPYLPLLPERGVWASDIGRTSALLTDFPVEVGPHGYRAAGRAGADLRRATGFLAQDVDALEEMLERDGRPGSAMVAEVIGPVSLAAALDLANGHQALSDRGAVRDLAASLHDGVRSHVTELRRRLRRDVVLRLREPFLRDALRGEIPTVSGLGTLPAVPANAAVELLRPFTDVGAAGLVLSSAISDSTLAVLRELPDVGVWAPSSQLSSRHDDQWGWLFEAGRTVGLGLVPAREPVLAEGQRALSVKALLAPALTLAGQLGFPLPVLANQTHVTPTGDFDPKNGAWAAAALKLTTQVAAALADAASGEG
jgi:hypothetical protein